MTGLITFISVVIFIVVIAFSGKYFSMVEKGIDASIAQKEKKVASKLKDK